jgi:hypothetical protein
MSTETVVALFNIMYALFYFGLAILVELASSRFDKLSPLYVYCAMIPYFIGMATITLFY